MTLRERLLVISLVLATLGGIAYAVTGSPTEEAVFGKLTVTSELTANAMRADAVPTAETIASGGTVTANACGGMKRITAAGAVTTSTTATFTAPATANKGCKMFVYNTGANAITLDTQTAYLGVAGANVVLAQNEGVCVINDGTIWYSCSPKIANHV
jgi:hypothetical protein